MSIPNSTKEHRDQSEAEWRSISIEASKSGRPKRLPGGVARRADRDSTSYSEYLAIDQLLSAQRPLTDVPDERIFITVHHLFEIAFKQMLADLTVIDLMAVQLSKGIDSHGREWLTTRPDSFWRSATNASNRLVHTVTKVLTEVFRFLSFNPTAETFNSASFALFRPSLIGASGFQSAQFRAIQKTLGKEMLFKIRPILLWNKAEKSWCLLEIDHPDALRDSLPQSPRLDTHLHSLLGRLAGSHGGHPEEGGLSLMQTDFAQAIAEFPQHLERVAAYESNLRRRAIMIQQSPELQRSFLRSVRHSLNAENRRRRQFNSGRTGGEVLRSEYPSIPLIPILDNLVLVDRTLFGGGDAGAGFLGHHKTTVHQRIEEATELSPKSLKQPAGTGGQGSSYLEFNRRFLSSRFPMLTAWRGERVVEL